MDQLTGYRVPRRVGRTVGRLAMSAVVLATAAFPGGAAEAATAWTIPLATNSTGHAQAGTLTAPSAVTASCTGTRVPVIVTWTAATSATSYTVSEATTLTGTYNVVATGVTSTTYTYTPGSAGDHYWKVTANRSGWSSAASAPTATGRTTYGTGNGNCT
jgi:hypothetical protein